MSDDAQQDIRVRIAEAGLRRVASGGIVALTMRTVASEAGCSLGLVQRTFGSRGDLLLACMERVIARVEERLATVDFSTAPPSEALAALIDVLLADDHEEEGSVWLAFVGEAAVSPSLRDTLRRQEDEAQAVFAALLGADTTARQSDIDAAALSALSLVNGLGEQLALGRCTGAQARAAAHGYIAILRADSSHPSPGA